MIRIATLVSAGLSAIVCIGCSAIRSNPLNPPVPRSKALFGPVVGLNRNFHTGGFRSITDPTCPHFEDGKGMGYLVGMTAEILPSVYSPWSIIPRVIYEQRPGKFNQRLEKAYVLMPGANDPVEQIVEASSDIAYTMFGAEIFYKYEVLNTGGARIAVAGGPTAAYVLAGANSQALNLVRPENARFTNPEDYPTEREGRTLRLYEGSIPSMRNYRFSLKGGVQAEIPVFGRQWYMTPGLYYDYGLTDITTSENWQLNSFVFMIDFRHAF